MHRRRSGWNRPRTSLSVRKTLDNSSSATTARKRKSVARRSACASNSLVRSACHRAFRYSPKETASSSSTTRGLGFRDEQHNVQRMHVDTAEHVAITHHRINSVLQIEKWPARLSWLPCWTLGCFTDESIATAGHKLITHHFDGHAHAAQRQRSVFGTQRRPPAMRDE